MKSRVLLLMVSALIVSALRLSAQPVITDLQIRRPDPPAGEGGPAGGGWRLIGLFRLALHGREAQSSVAAERRAV